MKSLVIAACSLCNASDGLVLAAPPAGKIEFNRHIRPVLSDRCFACHGPDSRARKADLRLDIRDEAIKTRGKIQPIAPGHPEKSELVARIFAEDASDRMPPPKSKLSLTQQQKELLKEWIQQGAEYQPQWSLIPVPETVPVPQVKNADWPRSDLDHFVLARLEAENAAPAADTAPADAKPVEARAPLQPSPEASRNRWLRRVTFDLTGLPPTHTEISDFLADRSADAYERVVDRLLASPRYGEHMAVAWLDVARYADSFGYQADLDTHAWPYRDWVVKAYNDNLPYDQFITWQIAGDLLEKPTREQRLATAFCRVHRKTQEGGSIVEEFRQDGISDRVHTFGTAFLGLTIECARCHDHKYDPITMRDYYSLGAFFNSIDEWGLLHGNSAVQPNPVLYLTTPEQDTALAKARQEIERQEAALVNLRTARESAFQDWLKRKDRERERKRDRQKGSGPSVSPSLNLSVSPSLPSAAPTLPIDLAGSFDFEHATDGKLRNAANQKEWGTTAPANKFVLGRSGYAIQLTGDDPVTLSHCGVRHMHDPITVAFWLKPAEDYPRAVVFHNSTGADPGFNGYELLLEHSQLRWMLAREWPGNCIAVRSKAKLPVGDWTHVAVSYDGSARAAGLHIYLNGQPTDIEIVRDKLAKDSADGGKIDFGERFRDSGLRNGVVDEVAIFTRDITPIEVRQLVDGRSLSDLVGSVVRTEGSPAPGDAASAERTLREYYLSAIDPEMRKAVAALHAARTKWREIMDQVREIPVMQELPQPRPAFILARGQYDAPKEPVSRETPSWLPPFPKDAPRNRLGLAKWLTMPNHPLTARVEVNRLWQRFFGRGLVVTAENFGQQGQMPSHPELLDWLARDFINHGWDIKRFCKQVVLSATYRQDSRASRELRERDPDNVLLARGPARRLSAEELRDSALALGGLLRPQIGGPPAKPYEPEAAMWKALNNFLPRYERDKGDGLYRRSMYTFWRRTTPPPDMLVFDAGTHEICAARRQLTLTPLQPLVTLNSVQFVEAARALGERMLTHGGDTPEQRAVWGFVEVTGREPTDAERKLLVEMYQEQIACYEKDASLADKLLKVGDYQNDPRLPRDQLAAAAMTASALINLDANIMLR